MQHSLTGHTLVIATGHALSLALLADGKVLAESSMAIDRGHAEALIPALALLLEPFGGPGFRCDHIVVEVGPGSFTGLRIGIAAAKGLALVWNSSVQGVRSTQLVAAQARAEGVVAPLLVALAATRGQIWVEQFAAGGLSSLGSPQALGEVQVAALVQPLDVVVGSAASRLGAPGSADGPRAAALLGVAEADLMQAEPLYVRAGEMDASTRSS